MKRLFTLTLVVISLFANAQYLAEGDTADIQVIDFEEVTDNILIPEVEGNLWQISEPNKTFFNSAYSPINAIITDEVDNYPLNNHSYFDMYISGVGGQNGLPQMQIQFKHKFDTDSLLDGGYISISYDGGLNWKNVIDDESQFFETTPLEGYYNSNMYTQEDVLFNGQKGFSGHSGSWQTTQITWLSMPRNASRKPNFAPIILRFNFISDDIDNDKEGWMIDDIRMFYVDLGGAINEKQNTAFVISPNPTKDFVTVKLLESQLKEMTSVEIYNLSGQLVKQEELQTTESGISVESLDKGIYILKIGEQKQRLLVE